MIKQTNNREYSQFFIGTIENPGVAAQESVTKKIETGLTVIQKIGWELSAIEAYLVDPWDTTPEDLDSVRFSLGSSANPSSLQSPSCYLSRGWLRIGGNQDNPVVPKRDGGFMPNPLVWYLDEPVLCLPQAMYLNLEVAGTGVLNVMTWVLRVHYRNIELKEAEFYDLLQLYNPLGAI